MTNGGLIWTASCQACETLSDQVVLLHPMTEITERLTIHDTGVPQKFNFSGLLNQNQPEISCPPRTIEPVEHIGWGSRARRFKTVPSVSEENFPINKTEPGHISPLRPFGPMIKPQSG